ARPRSPARTRALAIVGVGTRGPVRWRWCAACANASRSGRQPRITSGRYMVEISMVWPNWIRPAAGERPVASGSHGRRWPVLLVLATLASVGVATPTEAQVVGGGGGVHRSGVPRPLS